VLQCLNIPQQVVPTPIFFFNFKCVAVSYGELQCVAVCCSVVQCGAVCCSTLQDVAVSEHPTTGATGHEIRFNTHFVVFEITCSVLQCVAVYCSVLQCIAMCQSVLQRVAACCSENS